MLLHFTIKEQKITHDLGKRTLVAGSVGIVQADFSFDSSWDGLDKVVVFSNSNKKCLSPQPVRYENAPVDIPSSVLKNGKLYVSVVGFGAWKKRITTRAWDVQEAIPIQSCGAMGECDHLYAMTFGEESTDRDIATDSEIDAMLDDVFETERGEFYGI